jgi:hypothetical protein
MKLETVGQATLNAIQVVEFGDGLRFDRSDWPTFLNIDVSGVPGV